MIDLLRTLCLADGVSGYEENFLSSLAERITPFADDVWFDRLGNLVAFKRGAKRPKNKVLFAAHADEVGLVVKHIDENGRLLFDAIGILPSALPSRRLRVGKEKLPGVIASKAVHLMSKEERGKAVKEDELYIDIGAKDKADAEAHISIGDCAAFDSDFVFLSERTVKAKALDDRAGCAVLLELLRSELAYDSYFAFTRREELGTLGAYAVAAEIRPDVCVVCEATTAQDVAGTPESKKTTRLGEGAAVPFMDGGTVYDRALYDLCAKVAAENGIRTQTKTAIAGGTDARTFQRTGKPCRVLGVALPCRYIHSASGVCDTRDLASMKNLVFALEKKLGGADLPNGYENRPLTTEDR